MSSNNRLFLLIILNAYVYFYVQKSLEKFNLQNKLRNHLDRFYESIGHVKKQQTTG